MVLECTADDPETKKESIQRTWDFSNVFMNYMDIWAPKTGDSDLEVTPEEKTSTISLRQQFTMTREF